MASPSKILLLMRADACTRAQIEVLSCGPEAVFSRLIRGEKMAFGDGSYYEVTAFEFTDESSRSKTWMLMETAVEHIAYHAKIRPENLCWVKTLTDEEAELWKRKH